MTNLNDLLPYLNSAFDWTLKNKDWLFSGIALSVLNFIYKNEKVAAISLILIVMLITYKTWPQPPQIHTFPIDVKNQRIPVNYKNWVDGAGNTFVAEKPFFIMNKEVTVAEFEYFFQNLSKEQQEKIGKNWIQDNKDAPVTSISWETAHEYANWLSQQTGDSWSLPTYNQWLAAVIYSKPNIEQEIVRENAPQKANGTPMPIIRTGELNNVVDLLGNVREWSLDTCEGNGHYVLGADYMIMRDKHLNDDRKPLCWTSDSITIGFRLVKVNR